MIELTEQQAEALGGAGDDPPRVVNPRTRQAYVLLPVDEYARLKAEEYDDGPWTRADLEALAWEVGKDEDWEEYNDAPEKPLRKSRRSGSRRTSPANSLTSPARGLG